MCQGMCGSAKCAEDASASIQYMHMHRYFSYALMLIVNLFFLLAEVQISDFSDSSAIYYHAMFSLIDTARNKRV